MLRGRAFTALLLLCLAPLPAAAADPPCPPGCLRWEARWDGPAKALDDDKGLVASPDGQRAFMIGYIRQSFPSSPFDWATVAYDVDTGEQLWWRQHGSNDSDFAESVEVSADGQTVFVTGRVGPDIDTVAYDAHTGQTRWARRFDAGGTDSVFDVAASPDGSAVFVAGTSVRPSVQGTSTDFTVLAYDAGTGASLWTEHYDQLQFADNALRLQVAPDGSRVFATGLSSGIVSQFDIVTIAYDAATGAQAWLARFDGRQSDTPAGLAVAPDGSRVFVAGDSGGPGTGSDLITVAYDAATGAEVWVARHDGPASGTDHGRDVATDGELVYVVGDADAGGHMDMIVAAYDALTGARRWVTSYDSGDGLFEAGMALALDPPNDLLYAVGTSQTSGGANDFVTLAMDAPTGMRVWEARRDGGAADFASYVAVTPDGSTVLTTGYSEEPGGGQDSRDIITTAHRGGAALRAQDGPHLVDAAGDAGAVTGGRDLRPASVDAADLVSARLHTTYDAVPVGDDGIHHEPRTVVVRVGTTGRPASDTVPMSWALTMRTGACRSTLRFSEPGAALSWEQEAGCPAPGTASDSRWTVAIEDQGLTLEVPFQAMTALQRSLMGPGAILHSLEATSASGSALLDTTGVGTGFRVAGDVPPDVPCTRNCPGLEWW
jgi:WD40 repeat protein